MENIIDDNQSECSDTDSLSDLDPQTIDLTNGDFSPINTKLFNIASYNINSITCGNKRDQIESLAHQLNLAAICLTETKLDDNVHESFFHIPGYSIELKHRTRRGGGVCIYIRDDIPFVRVNKLENKNLEHISVDITIRGKKINLNVVYRPPSRNTPNQSAIEEDAAFLQNIETTLSKIRSHRSSTKIVCGDMNFGDCYNCYEGLPGKQLDDKAAPLFLENNFYQLIDIPTRKFNMSVSLIDLIFVNKTDDVVMTAVTPPISDHSGTVLSINTLNFKKPPREITLYEYENANWTEISNRLTELDTAVSNHIDIDSTVNEFTKILIDIRNDCVPHKKVKVYDKDQPWFDKDTRQKLTKKNRAFKVYSKAIDQVKRMGLNTGDNDKVKSRFEKYKAAKKDFEYNSRVSKQKYFNKLKSTLSNREISSQKKFTILKRLTCTGKNANIPPLIDNDTVIHKPSEKAEIFNKHFAKKSQLKGANDEAPDLPNIPTNYDLSDITTTRYEIGPLIKEMKNASYSPCGVPAKFLKEIHARFGSKITTPIANLLNLIFQSAHYPKSWKTANITPVYKRKGAMTDKSNWRPISILPTLSKICESIIHHRLLGHLLDNQIITEKQAAYLPKDSTTNQLLYIIHQIKLSWTKKKISHACFLDISAAFDSVWHNALIEKLKQINVTAKPFQLFKSYLTNRKARTVVDGATSPELDLDSGVPQGSRLGPLLFILFINDIINDLESTPHIFADDTSLIATANSTLETVATLNRDLARISSWATRWKVTFNAGKTKDIIFAKGSSDGTPPLTFNDTEIERVTRHKHLGLILTSKLTWDEHINAVVKQVNLKLSMLYNVRQLSRRTLDILYKMHVRSCIDYCIQVYGPCLNNNQIDKLDKLQYRAARITTMAMKFTSKQKLYEDLGWECIDKRIEFLSLCLFHKIHIHETRPQIRKCMPPVNIYPNFTRSNKHYGNYPENSSDFTNSFFPKISAKWNNLPFETRNKDLDEFKQDLIFRFKPQKYKVFNLGGKFGNSIHTQLRLSRSQLNDHLFSIRLSPSPKCLCGAIENTSHFLLDCFLYNEERLCLFNDLRGVLEKRIDRYSRNELVQILLHGEYPSDTGKYAHNKQLFSYVQKFLVSTKRLVYKSKLQYNPL